MPDASYEVKGSGSGTELTRQGHAAVKPTPHPPTQLPHLRLGGIGAPGLAARVVAAVLAGPQEQQREAYKALLGKELGGHVEYGGVVGPRGIPTRVGCVVEPCGDVSKVLREGRREGGQGVGVWSS
jgi:hypothetical protein